MRRRYLITSTSSIEIKISQGVWMRRRHCTFLHALTSGFLLLILIISLGYEAECMLIANSKLHHSSTSSIGINSSNTSLPTSASNNNDNKKSDSSTESSLGSGELKNKNTYKTVSPEDDEIHDDEIIEAVRNSLRLWQEGKLNKTHRNREKRSEKKPCYGELDCVYDEGPFAYLNMPPSSLAEIGTKFMIYTKDNEPEIYSYFNFTKMNVKSNSKFNASNPTKVIIHGFGSTCNRMWANEMRSALMSVVDSNVICVDWEKGAALPNYVKAAVNTRVVGKQLSLLIEKLVADSQGLTSYEDFHLIGFSLGAHVAGFTGQLLKNISRITGLDPAGPLFENYDKGVRLDSTDAVFVDVIHSNGDSLLMGGLGSWEPIGHLDFYPNGGRVQKGCSNLFLGAFRDLIWSSPSNKETANHQGSESRNGKSLPAEENDGRSLCNHRRAYRFFTESVSPRCPYPAFSCESYDKFLSGSCFQWDNQLVHSAHMGYYADEHQNNPRSAKQLSTTAPPTPPNKGINGGKNFYLMTRDDEPFCANQYKLKLESSPPLGVPISTYGGVEAIIINANDGLNETFLLTQTHKDNMISGSILQKLIVAHPAINEPAKLVLKYTAYKGWIYSGISRWSLDRVVITNAFGTSYSFCTRGLLLPSGISVTVTLNKGVCAVANFPYRYPYIHPNLHHIPGSGPSHINPHTLPPHPIHLMPPQPMYRNELNDTQSQHVSPTNQVQHQQHQNQPPTVNEIHPQQQNQNLIGPVNSNANTNQSPNQNLNKNMSEFIDWSNDWHPIILNKTLYKTEEDCVGAAKTNCNSNNNANTNDNVKNSNNAITQDGDHVNNEIDNNERRSGRQLLPMSSGPSPMLLVPLSRAIEPRPVILRTSHNPQDETQEIREGRRIPLITNANNGFDRNSQYVVYT